MEERYTVPAGFGEDEHTEKRSRFIGRVWRVETEQEALDHLAEIRSLERDARHNVWAFALHSGAMRFSDDGEPQGTGGMPVLDTFRKRGITDFCCVVTRYFGGILLGAGGLVRAYGKAAALALEAAGTAVMRPLAVLEVCCSYAQYDRVRQLAAAFGDKDPAAEWTDRVRLTVTIPTEQEQMFTAQLKELSAGTISVTPVAKRFDAFRE